MKKLQLITLVALMAVCVSTIAAEDKKVLVPPPLPPVAKEKKPDPPKIQPIEIAGETPGVSIDPQTLSLTWQKGSDPRQVAKTLVKLWAQVQSQLNQCQQAVQTLNLEIQNQREKK